MSSNSSTLSTTEQVPKFQGGHQFRNWFFFLNQYLRGVGHVPGGAPFNPRPEDYVNDGNIAAVHNREFAKVRREAQEKWDLIEGKCYLAVVSSLRENATATAHLQRVVELNPLVRPRTTDILEMLLHEYGQPSDYGLEHTQDILSAFKFKRLESIADGISRLDRAINEYILQGGVYTNQQRKTKLASALRNGEPQLDLLSSMVSMQLLDYRQIVDQLRHYDLSEDGKSRLRVDKVKALRDASISLLSGGSIPICEHCGKKGHTKDNCWKLHPNKRPNWVGKKKKAFKSSKKDGKKPETKFNKTAAFKFPGKGEPKSTVSMLTDVYSGDDNVTEDDIVFDTGASDELFIMIDKRHFDKFACIKRTIGCAANGAYLNVKGTGTIHQESNVYWCPDARHNLISEGRIHAWGLHYLSIPPDPPTLRWHNVVVAEGRYVSAIPTFKLEDILFHLRSQRTHLSDLLHPSWTGYDCHVEPFELEFIHDESTCFMLMSPEKTLKTWHNRLVHINYERLVNMDRKGLVQGMKLPREAHQKKHIEAAAQPCSACRLSKPRRRNFKTDHSVYADVKECGDLVVTDYQSFLNSPSRNGFFGAWNFTDIASKKTFTYLVVGKDAFLDCAKRLLQEEVKPRGYTWKKLRSDSDSAILSNKSLTWLLEQAIVLETSPTDTPEMNSEAELVHAWLYPATLALLIHGNMPAPFWEDAYRVASRIKGYIPVHTVFGFISPDEAWTKTVPNIKHLRSFGCKAWISEPRNERRKDWHPRAVVGRFIDYSDLPLGWICWVPEISDVVISVNVKFDEDIPDRAEEYFAELEPQLIMADPEDRKYSDFKKLCNRFYVDPDNGCLYQVTRIKTQADRTIVGYVRRVIEGHKKLREERQPVHIRDLERMIEESAADATVLHKNLTEVADRALIQSLSGLSCGPLAETQGMAHHDGDRISSGSVHHLFELADVGTGTVECEGVTLFGVNDSETNGCHTPAVAPALCTVFPGTARPCCLDNTVTRET